jgi:putative membrane protein
MKLSIVVASVSALILAGCASQEERDSSAMGAGGPVTTSQQSGSSQSYLGEQDQTFIKEAAQGGLMEVQMGRLGAQKGHTEPVRQLGQKLVQDHSKANQELKLLAAQKQVTLPTDMPTEAQAMLSHLKSLEGAEFDKAFKKHAIEDHQKDIQKFQTIAQQSADSDVKAFAQKTLPVLQQHLKMAQDIPSGEQTSTPSEASQSETRTIE